MGVYRNYASEIVRTAYNEMILAAAECPERYVEGLAVAADVRHLCYAAVVRHKDQLFRIEIVVSEKIQLCSKRAACGNDVHHADDDKQYGDYYEMFLFHSFSV